MKQKEITIGKVYAVKVSGKMVPVRITHTNRFGGWYGVNLSTNRVVIIKSAQRCRFEVVRKTNKLGDVSEGWVRV